VEKFVAVDFCGDAHAAVLSRLDAHYFTVAANVDVAGARDLFGQSDNELDGTAEFELGRGKKIKSTITDVAGLCGKFGRIRIARQKPHRQSHVESASFAAVGSVGHDTPGCWKTAKPYHRCVGDCNAKLQQFSSSTFVTVCCEDVHAIPTAGVMGCGSGNKDRTSTKACLDSQSGNILRKAPAHLQ